MEEVLLRRVIQDFPTPLAMKAHLKDLKDFDKKVGAPDSAHLYFMQRLDSVQRRLFEEKLSTIPNLNDVECYFSPAQRGKMDGDKMIRIFNNVARQITSPERLKATVVFKFHEMMHEDMYEKLINTTTDKILGHCVSTIPHIKKTVDVCKFGMKYVAFYKNRVIVEYCFATRQEFKSQFKKETSNEYCAWCKNSFAGNLLQTCGRCKGRKYCSRECQSADWKIGHHKKNCCSA